MPDKRIPSALTSWRTISTAGITITVTPGRGRRTDHDHYEADGRLEDNASVDPRICLASSSFGGIDIRLMPGTQVIFSDR